MLCSIHCLFNYCIYHSVFVLYFNRVSKDLKHHSSEMLDNKRPIRNFTILQYLGKFHDFGIFQHLGKFHNFVCRRTRHFKYVVVVSTNSKV